MSGRHSMYIKNKLFIWRLLTLPWSLNNKNVLPPRGGTQVHWVVSMWWRRSMAPSKRVYRLVIHLTCPGKVFIRWAEEQWMRMHCVEVEIGCWVGLGSVDLFLAAFHGNKKRQKSTTTFPATRTHNKLTIDLWAHRQTVSLPTHLGRSVFSR